MWPGVFKCVHTPTHKGTKPGRAEECCPTLPPITGPGKDNCRPQLISPRQGTRPPEQPWPFRDQDRDPSSSIRWGSGTRGACPCCWFPSSVNGQCPTDLGHLQALVHPARSPPESPARLWEWSTAGGLRGQAVCHPSPPDQDPSESKFSQRRSTSYSSPAPGPPVEEDPPCRQAQPPPPG